MSNADDSAADVSNVYTRNTFLRLDRNHYTQLELFLLSAHHRISGVCMLMAQSAFHIITRLYI